MLTGTFHSRIWGKARSTGICYGIDSSAYSSETGVSCWEFGAQVSTQNAAALFELIINELTKVRSGDISEMELDEAKVYALGRHQMRGQTVGGLNDWYTGDYFEDDTIDYLEKAPERINAVTRELMVKLADEFLASSTWTVGGIGNIDQDELQSHYDQLAKLFKKG
jgi:zinc protease